MAKCAGRRNFRKPILKKAASPVARRLLPLLVLCAASSPSSGHSWFSDYSTGRDAFESCCGDTDCRTAESLGHPQIVRRDDGGYNVRVGPHWIKYDFPAVHASHDARIWVCYLDVGAAAPEPLCLFLPPGIT